MKNILRIQMLAAVGLVLMLPVAALAEEAVAQAQAPADSAAPAKVEKVRKPKIKARKKETIPVAPAQAPSHITVQHVLIMFKGAPRSQATRSLSEAKKLAYDILQQARDGADFDALMKKYSEDPGPGIYKMANNGVKPSGADEVPRSGMVKAFGDIGFGMSPGNIDIAAYDAQASPFGYHVIKRLK
jgi:parvulin-like peptidyl-prolyl isomerase